MGRIALRSLTLHNFRSFKGLHTLDFPESGLVILRGTNHDTGGDSGAGKTNVLLALAYIFGYCQRSTKALQCWFDDAPMYVEVDLDTPTGRVTVRRGVKGISIGALKGKAAEAKLDEILGVPTELREILTYRDQVKPKKFLAMGDTALKEFLVEVLQLHGLDEEIVTATDLLSKLTEKNTAATNRLLNVKEEHSRREKELEPFHPEDTHALEAELGRLHVQIDQTRADFQGGADELTGAELDEQARAAYLAQDHEAQATALEGELQALRGAESVDVDRGAVVSVKAQLDKCESFLIDLEQTNRVQLDAFNHETQALRQRARVLHNELARVPGLVDDLTRLQAEADKLAVDNCDRCGRQWDNAKLALREHQRQIADREAVLALARSHKIEAKALEEQLTAQAFSPDPRLDKFKTVRSNLKAQLAAEEQRIKGEIARAAAASYQARTILDAQIAAARAQGRAAAQEYLSRPDRLSTRLRAGQDVLKQALNDLQRQLAELNGKLALVRQANRAGQAQYDLQAKHLAEAGRRLTEAHGEADAAALSWRALADYVDLLKGFRNKIFDEVLDAISTDANSIIATLPNSQHISIEFRSERETQKATVQEKITAITYLYGEPRALDDSVSGGQRTSIGLAVDLAVAGVICRRLGVYLNWIVLDESFEGHDPITKASCLEMLQRYASDKLVIIVDHMNEVKEVFSQSITVDFANKLSSLKVSS